MGDGWRNRRLGWVWSEGGFEKETARYCTGCCENGGRGDDLGLQPVGVLWGVARRQMYSTFALPYRWLGTDNDSRACLVLPTRTNR